MVPAILAALGEAGGATAGAGMGAEMANLGNATQRFQNSITALPNQVLKAEASIVHMGSTLVNILTAPIDTIERLGQSMTRFIQLSNPAAVTMFQFKVENSLAGVGRILEPILQSLGNAADKANEAMAKLAPAFQPFIDATVDVIESVGDSLVPAFRELAPWIKVAGENAKVMVAGVKSAADAFEGFALGAGGLGQMLRDVFGGFDENAQKSVAVRATHRTTSEGLQRELAERSITASLGGEKNKPVTTEGWLEKIYNLWKAFIDELHKEGEGGRKGFIGGAAADPDFRKGLGEGFVGGLGGLLAMIR